MAIAEKEFQIYSLYDSRPDFFHLTLQNPFGLVHQQTTWKGSMAIATPMYYGLPLESETPFGSGVASHLRLPQSKIN